MPYVPPDMVPVTPGDTGAAAPPPSAPAAPYVPPDMARVPVTTTADTPPAAPPEGTPDPGSWDAMFMPPKAVHGLAVQAARGAGEWGGPAAVAHLADVPAAIYNNPIHWLAKQAGYDIGQIPYYVGNAIHQNLTAQGAPEAQTPWERTAYGAGAGFGSAVSLPTAGRALEATALPYAAKVGQVLAQQPGVQTAVGTASGAAPGVAEAAGAPPWVQNMIGPLTALGSGLLPRTNTGLAGWGGFTGSAAVDLANTARNKFGIPVWNSETGPIASNIKLTQSANDAKQTAINAAAAKIYGATLSDDNLLTKQQLRSARPALGKPFDDISNNTTIPYDSDLDSELSAVKSDASRYGDATKMVRDYIDNVQTMGKDPANAGNLPTDYVVGELGASSDLQKNARLPGTEGNMWRQTSTVLDNALRDNADPADLAAYDAAKPQYAAAKVIEKAAKAGDGNITGPKLQMAIRNSKAPIDPDSDLQQLANVATRYGPQTAGGPSARTLGYEAALAAPTAIGMWAAGRPWWEAAAPMILPAAHMTGSAIGRGISSIGSGLTPTPSALQYYARALMNPVTLPSSTGNQ